MKAFSERPLYICPFTILVDSAETHPWTFAGFKSDARHQNRLTTTNTKWKSLGRYPNGLGDYSIEGLEGLIHIERKSVEDFQGTILGFPKKDSDGIVQGTSRRERFEKELENLSHMTSAVIIEGNEIDCLQNIPDYGTKSPEVNAKIIRRTINAYQMDCTVSFCFCESRRAAEAKCFRMFERFYRKHIASANKIVKQRKRFSHL